MADLTSMINSITNIAKDYWYIYAILLIAILYSFYKWMKNRKTKKAQEIKPEIIKEHEAVSIIAEPEPTDILEKIGKELNLGTDETGDVVDVANRNIDDLNKVLKEELAIFNKRLKESKEGINKEEGKINQEAQVILARVRQLRATKEKINKSIGLTEMK